MAATEAAIKTQGETAPRVKVWSYINYTPMVIVLIALSALFAAYRIFQQVYGFSVGLDSTTPEFDSIWIGLLKAELVIIVLMWGTTWSYLWLTRDRHLDQIQPREELKRYFTLVMWLLVYAFAVFFAGSFFAEQDAAWHQTVVRDTSFTPSHIVLFYGTMPLYVVFGVGSFLYAMTRLPQYAENISIPLLLVVVGPFLILPNLGYNEWGHAFWLMEEVFTAPLHWGFVVLGWTLVALGGVLVQAMQRVMELFDKIEAEDAATAS